MLEGHVHTAIFPVRAVSSLEISSHSLPLALLQ